MGVWSSGLSSHATSMLNEERQNIQIWLAGDCTST